MQVWVLVRESTQYTPATIAFDGVGVVGVYLTEERARHARDTIVEKSGRPGLVNTYSITEQPVR